MKKYISILLILLILSTLITLPVSAVYDIEINNGTMTPVITDNNGTEYTDGGTGFFMERYRNIAVFIGGLATITMVIIVIYNVSRLSLTSGNPMERRNCLRGILISGVMCALLGGATLFIGLFYGLFR